MKLYILGLLLAGFMSESTYAAAPDHEYNLKCYLFDRGRVTGKTRQRGELFFAVGQKKTVCARIAEQFALCEKDLDAGRMLGTNFAYACDSVVCEDLNPNGRSLRLVTRGSKDPNLDYCEAGSHKNAR